VKAALSAMTVKTDRNGARGIAQLIRMGWFRPVHAKALPAQEVRTLLTGRKLLQSKLLDLEGGIRGMLRGFGLKVGPVGAAGFEDGDLREAIDFQIGHRILHGIEMARLSGEIEKVILALQQRPQAVQIAHIGNVDVHALAQRLDVETIAAVFRNEAVDQRDLGAEGVQARGQVRADEAESAGNQDFFLCEMFLHRGGRFFYESGPQAGEGKSRLLAAGFDGGDGDQVRGKIVRGEGLDVHFDQTNEWTTEVRALSATAIDDHADSGDDTAPLADDVDCLLHATAARNDIFRDDEPLVRRNLETAAQDQSAALFLREDMTFA
jgi:hypothetical protein